MSSPRRFREQLAIELPRQAASARGGGDRDAVDIDEALVALAKPPEIRTVVVGVLIESEQERIEMADAARKEALANEMCQTRRLQPGQFPRMGVVEREQGGSQWRRWRHLCVGDGE